MTLLDKTLCALVVVASVAVFYALVNFLGGYGAIIASCIVAGLATTNPND